MIDLKLDWIQLYLLRQQTAEAKRQKLSLHTQLEPLQEQFKRASDTHLRLAKQQQELEKSLFLEFSGIHKLPHRGGPHKYSPPKRTPLLATPKSEAQIDQLLELLLHGDFEAGIQLLKR
jgi:hypothetical protein